MKICRFVLYLLSMVLISVSLGASWNELAGAAVSPKKLTGRLLVRTNDPLALRSLVTLSMLKGGSISNEALLGKHGYALATIGNYQYPVSTDNHGQHWRIAGDYFNMVSTSGMGAGGTATDVSMFSRAIAVAFRAGDILRGTNSNVYVTFDSGRHWYVTSLPGTVHGVEVNHAKPNHSALSAIVQSSSPSGGKSTYVSLNEGRNWSLE